MSRSCASCAGRDFHRQVAFAFPELGRRDYRGPGRRWRHDPAAVSSWRDGCTGVPIVDAAMRQLRVEGFVHNRTRMLAAAYLTKELGVDWRIGAAHFADWLVDADVANNVGNWQWIAGTGNDTRPNRRFNLMRQARRHDPDGTYVRRYVPELREVPGGAVHEPWMLPEERLRAIGYEPLGGWAEARGGDQVGIFRYASSRRPGGAGRGLALPAAPSGASSRRGSRWRSWRRRPPRGRPCRAAAPGRPALGGPAPRPWPGDEAEHGFVDELVSLPLRWRHTHGFEAVGASATRVSDAVDTPVPGRFLLQTFRYRQRQLGDDLAAHARSASFGARPSTVAVTGSSGLVGSALCVYLSTGGYRVRAAGQGRAAPGR